MGWCCLPHARDQTQPRGTIHPSCSSSLEEKLQPDHPCVCSHHPPLKQTSYLQESKCPWEMERLPCLGLLRKFRAGFREQKPLVSQWSLLLHGRDYQFLPARGNHHILPALEITSDHWRLYNRAGNEIGS